MPGSADISGLNLQFGALQFGSEPVLSDYESTPPRAPLQARLQVASIPARPVNLHPQFHLTRVRSPVIRVAQFSRQPIPPKIMLRALYEQRSTQTRRYPSSISSSPQKDLTQAKNGFSSVQATQLQTTQSVEGATGSAVKSDSPSTSGIPLSVKRYLQLPY